MHRFNKSYFEKLTAAVAEAESETRADIVVAVEPWSGNYRDVDFGFGMALSVAGLLALLYSRYVFPEWAAAVDVVIFFLLGAWVCHSIHPLRRLLTSEKRRQSQVNAAAGADFYRARIWTTHRRTGLLIYVSLLEKELVLLADTGIQAALGETAWQECVQHLRQFRSAPHLTDHLLEGIRKLGHELALALPETADTPHELTETVIRN